MSDRFYTNSALSLGEVLLQGPEAHHLAKVCRFHSGDIVSLFNGDGREYVARVDAVERKHVALTVLAIEERSRELPVRLEVAVPLPKGERSEFLVEKLTEVGASDLVPLRTERSVVHPRETKLERLQRTVIEASKQCGRNRLMRIHELTDWKEYCVRLNLPAVKLLAHRDGEPLKETVSASDIYCAVGPEGGFSEGELALAADVGWKMVTLGPCTLRLETAAMAMAILASRKT